MLCHWALSEGELGSFLDTAMDGEVMRDYYRTNFYICQFHYLDLSFTWRSPLSEKTHAKHRNLLQIFFLLWKEQDVVFRVLKLYADIEISRSLYPAPCVDVLILWLAMNRKAAEALKVSYCTVLNSEESSSRIFCGDFLIPLPFLFYLIMSPFCYSY